MDGVKGLQAPWNGFDVPAVSNRHLFSQLVPTKGERGHVVAGNPLANKVLFAFYGAWNLMGYRMSSLGKTVALPKNPGYRVVVQETRKTVSVVLVFLSLVGLAAVAWTIAQPSRALDENLSSPLVGAFLFSFVLTMGSLALAAWRQSGILEVVEIKQGRVRLMSSFSHQTFDAPIGEVRVQRLAPSVGQMRLFLRDGTRAAEVGTGLVPESKVQVAQEVEAMIGAHQASAALANG